MPPKFKSPKEKPKCRVNADWLSRKDPEGRVISSWAEQRGDSQVHCRPCQKSFLCEKKGFQAITQHLETALHKSRVIEFFDSFQARMTQLGTREDTPVSAIVPVTPSASQSNLTSPAPAQGTMVLYSLKDKAVAAELRWLLKCVASNYSTSSCDGIEDLFRAMFGEGVPKDFCLGRTKASYYMTEALGPFFRNEMLEDIGNAYYTLHFDETTNIESMKELQVSLQYWSSKDQEIVFRHLQTFFIGKADADTLTENLEKALSNADLSVTKMLTLGRDGPNVNKAVFRRMNEIVKSARDTGLLDIGSCNIHILHNAFLAGLEQFGADIEAFVLAVFAFFDGWPLRIEEYEESQAKLKVPIHRFIKHVSSRWLTLSPVAKRILEQWPALYDYFIKVIPNLSGNAGRKRSKALMNLVQYKTIASALKNPLKRAELEFLVESAEVFERYSKILQKSEPLIHVLYENLEELTALLMRRAYKPEATLCLSSIEIPNNLLPTDKVDCGGAAEKTLKDSNSNQLAVTMFRKNVQDHYVAAVTHLMKKSVLSAPNLTKHFRCLKPNERDRDRSEKSIQIIAKALPTQANQNRVVDEWRLLRLEEGVKSEDSEGNPLRVDHYWREIFKIKDAANETKYKNLAEVVKAALSLSHGSAEVERGFSSSGLILTPDKGKMEERTLNAKLNIKSGMKRYGGRPELVPIGQKLRSLARSARQSYEDYQQNERKEREKAKERAEEEEEERLKREEAVKKQDEASKDIASLEAELDRAEKDLNSKQSAADALLKQANDSLKQSLNSKNFEGIRTAQQWRFQAAILGGGGYEIPTSTHPTVFQPPPSPQKIS